MILLNKLQVKPETPPLRLGAQLGAQTPLRRVKLLIYIEKKWRG